METRLFKKHTSGAVGYWRIWCEEPFIKFAYSVTGSGAEAVNQDLIQLNASGRDWATQALLEMQSRAKRKMQRGYKLTPEEARSAKGTNLLGMPSPMTALRLASTELKGPFWLQPKFNGHRCMIAKTDGVMSAYSRLGTPITTVDHLLAAIEPSMPDDAVIDGELYVHRWKLQRIASAIKRAQADTNNLTFICYDVVDGQAAYGERFEMLKQIIKPAWTLDNRINGCQTKVIHTLDEAWAGFHQHRAAGYEGAMLRLDSVGYRSGVRSSSLLKLKAQEDGEFRILDVRLEKPDYPVMTLETASGRPFNCTAPGSLPEKMQFYNDRASHIGKMMTCEYAELTADGIPFHCVALQLRDDI